MNPISEHISFDEAVHSQAGERAGIKNTPNEEQIKNMEIVAKACFEPMRKWWGKPLIVSSFFRCVEVNKLVGGQPTSQHQAGKAIDICAQNRADNLKLYEWAKANLKFDQLICEFPDANGVPAWVHISFNLGQNRNQSFTIK